MRILVKHFEVVKFNAQGNFSMVYEARSTKGVDEGTSYALKRFYLRNADAVRNAIHEQRILKRLAMQESQLLFVETLVYSYFNWGKPVLILNKCSGVDLSDVLRFFFPLSMQRARFYCSEIICGLQQIHALGIIHLDIKPNNVLLSLSGHIQITDFDCAYDTTYNQSPPKSEDYKGTLLYEPPEIANKQSISFAADIWNVGMTMGHMISRYIRPNATTMKERYEMASRGEWIIEGFDQLASPLKSFFHSCLRLNPIERPSIDEIKQMEFFSGINWEAEELMNRSPPYQIAHLCDLVEREKYPFDLSDKTLLTAVKWKGKPNLCGAEYCGRDLVIRKSRPTQSDIVSLHRAAMTAEVIAELFADYEFINEKVIQTQF